MAQSEIQVDSIVKSTVQNYIKPNIAINGRINIAIDYNHQVLGNPSYLNYKLNASLTGNFYGITVPINFTFTNGRTALGYNLNTFRLPSFNRIGFSPQYRDYTLHIGFRSLNYQKYTLSGLQFKGVGVEYQPENYYLSAMKGTLRPAIDEETSINSLVDPSFKRRGWGMKAGISREQLNLGFSFIHAQDEPTSIQEYRDIIPMIRPAENAVFGSYVSFNPTEKLNIEGEFAFSGMSYNIIDDPYLDITTYYTAYNFFGLFTTRENSIYDKAYNGKISYSVGTHEVAYNTEKVDPHFRTLGAVFFNNNFHTRTGSVSGQVLQERLLYNVELGTEHKAESKSNEERTGRFVGSSGLKYKINDLISLNGKYSNMNNSSLVRKPSLQSSSIDSILQTQTKERIQLSSTYTFGKEKNKNLVFSLGLQRGIIVDRNQNLTNSTNTARNMGASYQISQDKTSHSFSYNLAHIEDSRSSLVNQSITYNTQKSISDSRSFFSNASIALTNSHLLNSIILEHEIGYNLVYQKKHNLKSSLATQLGINETELQRNTLFSIVVKFNYDLSFMKQIE